MPVDFVRQARVRAVWMSLAALAVIGGVLLFIGPTWFGFGVMLAICLTGRVLFELFFRPWRLREQSGRATQPCPFCQSLQTDAVTRYDADGVEQQHLHCFACDKDFAP